MAKSKKELLGARLTPQQRLAAQEMVDNQFGLLTEDGSKLTNLQLQERLGIGNDTFYRWRRDSDFIAYMNVLADEELDVNRAEVYAQLIKAVRGGANGIPSVKALDLYMKRFGLLVERSVITDEREDAYRPVKTDAQIAAELAELDRMINGEDTVH